MVPNAREDLPDPETPVNTTSASRGMSTSMLRRLCSRAPRTRTMQSLRISGLDAFASTIFGCREFRSGLTRRSVAPTHSSDSLVMYSHCLQVSAQWTWRQHHDSDGPMARETDG